MGQKATPSSGDEAAENESSAQVPGHGSSRGYPDSLSARDSPNPAPASWVQ